VAHNTEAERNMNMFIANIQRRKKKDRRDSYNN